MNWFDDFQPHPSSIDSLGKKTSFGIGGPAPVYFEPKDTKEAALIMKRCGRGGVRKYFLGRGTNLLVRDDGVQGAVLSTRRFSSIQVEGNRVRAGAGASLQRLIGICIDRRLSGLEGLAGIPGSLGGAIAQNAGGEWGEIGEVLESVRTVDGEGRTQVREREDLRLGYRRAQLNGEFLIEGVLALQWGNLRRIRARVIQVLQRKEERQPLHQKSAGCIFKNPEGVSAGFLIERAGLKGCAIGDMVVSKKHANFILNLGIGNSRDALALIELVEREVEKRFGIRLEREIVVWPDG